MKKFIFLPVLLVISILIFAAAGAYLKYDLFPTLQMETAENVITLPFVLLTDEQLSFRFSTRLEAYQNPTEPTIPTSAPTQPSETEAPTVPEETEPIPTETEPTEPPYIELDDSWFVTKREVKKKDLTEAIKAGQTFEGIHLQEKRNLQLK